MVMMVVVVEMLLLLLLLHMRILRCVVMMREMVERCRRRRRRRTLHSGTVLVVVMVVRLIFRVQLMLLPPCPTTHARCQRLMDTGTDRCADSVRLIVAATAVRATVRWKEVILIESQRGERLRLVGYLMVVMVGGTAATTGGGGVANAQTVTVEVVGRNRWRVVREQLHARLDWLLLLLLQLQLLLLLLLFDGEMILAQLEEAGGRLLTANARRHAVVTAKYGTSPPRRWRGSL